MLTLDRVLVDYDLDLLLIIAAQWDIDLTARERASAAEELAVQMVRPDAVEATWERLTDEERAALNDLLAHEGRLLYSHFTRRYGEPRPMGPARREREKPWLSPDNVAEALYYRGLIVRAFEQTPSGAQEHIVIPDDLRALLPEPEPDAVIAAPGYAVAPPRRFEGGQPTAPDDIATLLAYLLLRAESAREWLSNGPVEKIDRHLRRRDRPACRALLTQLAYDLDLVADQEVLTHIVTQVNKDAVRPWLEAPRLHQLRSLAETWLVSTAWNDLAYTPGLEADDWPNDPRLARQAIVEAMRRVPAEIWWSLGGFVEHIKQTNPDFQRPGGDYAAWYLRDAYTGEIMHGFAYWDHVEGALLRFIIEGPMRWLGLVHAEYGAFLLTPLGLALLGRADWPSAPDPEARIQVDEQGVITVPPDLSRYERLQIARFAAWIDAPPPAPGLPGGREAGQGGYLYRLTPQAIARAAEEGVTLPSHIVPFLQRLSGHSLPDNVLEMLQAWHEQPGEVVVQDVVIVVARDISVYQRLRANERVNRWLGQPVGPRAHAVRREDMPALLNAIREMGILPLFEGYEKDDWP
jgi:hypothetical protein